jgi:hypothetical protein
MKLKTIIKSISASLGCGIIILFAGAVSAEAAAAGDTVSGVQIRDAYDKPAWIPGIGTTVVGLFYNDAETSDLGDPLADAIKARNYGKDVYTGLGIANMKDSAAPNFIIRSVIKGKIEKYKSTILTDVDLTLPKAWGLGECDNKSIFILIGKDKKIKYIKYVTKSTPWAKAEIDSIIKMIDGLLKK